MYFVGSMIVGVGHVGHTVIRIGCVGVGSISVFCVSAYCLGKGCVLQVGNMGVDLVSKCDFKEINFSQFIIRKLILEY